MRTPGPRDILLAAISSAAVLATASSLRAELRPCLDVGERAECGRFSVPENPTHPDGRKIDLNVQVLRAEKEANHEPVFMLAGGPGQAATDLAGLALGPFAEVNQTRDFVLVDHRGTGRSNPIHCRTDAEAKPSSAFGYLFDSNQISACLKVAERHADVTLYTSRYAVGDLEAVRKELGYGQVILWGGSGGTRTGLVYMREFPASIKAALFDGVAPTDFRAPSGFAPAAQRALDRVFEDCSRQASCAATYPELERDFARVLELFNDGPVETDFEANGQPVTVFMNRNDFAYTIRGLLYSGRRTARLPLMIHRAATSGDLGQFAAAHWGRHAAVLPSIAIGVHLSVYCAEDLPFIQWRQIEAPTRASFLGRYLLDQYSNACRAWHSKPEPVEFTQPVTTDVPVLLFSGYYDPSTPGGIAEATSEHLPNARHVVARDEGHNAQFGCARPLAIEFLKQASLEGLGPACEGVGPIEFEVPEDGPAETGP